MPSLAESIRLKVRANSRKMENCIANALRYTTDNSEKQRCWELQLQHLADQTRRKTAIHGTSVQEVMRTQYYNSEFGEGEEEERNKVAMDLS
nr:hypothetical protein Iba_chr05cCG15320 [Ipomoea batatas]GMD01730.1 hypothetical protein Iba_chr05fCG10100 [Ipomoea batatas]